MLLQTAFEQLKAVGLAVGATTAIWGVYTTAGLPVPATVQMVNTRMSEVKGGLKSLTQLVLEGQIEQHDSRRIQLRQELLALRHTIATASEETANTLQGRVSQIEDELKALNDRDGVLRTCLRELHDEKAA